MKTVKKILIDIYGENLVEDNLFQTADNEEKIAYFASGMEFSGERVLWRNNAQDICRKILEETQNDKKCFIFLTKTDFPEHIFSVELCEINNRINNVEFLTKQEILNKLQSGKSIVRFEKTKKANKVFLVAIKIGTEQKRDYTAFKNYIESSDNRTYNKVVRNMIEYIEMEGKKVQKNETKLPHNLLVSGAPGTGKSHFLAEQVIEAGKEYIAETKDKDKSQNNAKIKETTANKQYCDRFVTRVTFYEDYSYENFIGCYKPIPRKSEAQIKYCGNEGTMEETKITYDYVSGPFIDVYVKAKKDPEYNYFLIIEEINRAKAASVFGEIFQLLDRDSKGVSKYDIKPDAALNAYLADKLGDEYDGFMKLPHNMYIWATMNSADQGVMPLDSAFKRRWSSMYMDINGSTCNYSMWIQKSRTTIGEIKWDELRKKINDVILNNGFDEDRCIGPWYFLDTEISQIKNYYYYEKDVKKEDDSEETIYYLTQTDDRLTLVNPLIDKLFFYLRQDVFRRNPSAIFNKKEDGITMSDIRRRVRQGENIETILNLGEGNKLTWCQTIETTLRDSNNTGEGSDAETPSEV